MNASTLVSKVWNFAHVLRDQGVSYKAYISQISYLRFLKMDEERVTQIGDPYAVSEDCAGHCRHQCHGPVYRARSQPFSL